MMCENSNNHWAWQNFQNRPYIFFDIQYNIIINDYHKIHILGEPNMFYLGIIFLLIAVWQSNMRGALSSILTLIFGLLGIFFIFIGNWHAGLFLVFLYISWFLLMKIYSFSTYHLYFGKAIFLLVGYAVLMGDFSVDKNRYISSHVVQFLLSTHNYHWISKSYVNMQ